MSANEAAAAAAVVGGQAVSPSPSTPASTSAPSSAGPAPKKRARRPKIDIDEEIARHVAEVKVAAKLAAAARQNVRNQKRRKTRLIQKAANLTPEDLERIAVLKRCGLMPAKAAAADENPGPCVSAGGPSSGLTRAKGAAAALPVPDPASAPDAEMPAAPEQEPLSDHD